MSAARTCVICTAPVDYARYGAEACRSCSEFYRRTLVAGRSFMCRQGDGNCTVNPKDRHNCRGCRFKKCGEIMKYHSKKEPTVEITPEPCDEATSDAPNESRASPPSPTYPETVMECLICYESISNSRLGVNSCRACAAFFKRSDALFDTLKCKRRTNDCRERDPKTTCRKCRLVRFREVLSRAGEGFPVIELNSGDDEPTASTFIDHTSFYECKPSYSDTPRLNKIRKGFSYMCVIRRCGESPLTEGYSGNGEVRTDNLVLTPASYSSFIQIHSIAREATIECANFAFEDFRTLESSSKAHIVDRSLLVIDVLESTYRASHHFPDDNNVRLSGYTTFLREEDLETFFEKSPDAIDKTVLIREFTHTMKRLSTIVRQLFEIIRPSDVEFVAMLGLAYWKEENMKHDENLLKVASRMRADILRELHVHYARKGVRDYAVRLGSMYCQLMNCEDCAALFSEDFQLFRLLKLWESFFSAKKSIHSF